MYLAENMHKMQTVIMQPLLQGPRSVADPAMGGPGDPPIDQNLGLVMAARNSLPQTRGQIFI